LLVDFVGDVAAFINIYVNAFPDLDLITDSGVTGSLRPESIGTRPLVFLIGPSLGSTRKGFGI
jgi:hypothetical protein